MAAPDDPTDTAARDGTDNNVCTRCPHRMRAHDETGCLRIGCSCTIQVTAARDADPVSGHTAEKDVTEFVAYVEQKWGGGTGHTANNRWVSHAELRKYAEAFNEERAIWRQADEQCQRPAEARVTPPTEGRS